MAKDADNLDRSAGAIRGRSMRICEVVANEIEQLSPSQYVENVKIATRRLRDNGKFLTKFFLKNLVLPQFSMRAEKIYSNMNDPNMEDENNVDEMIDACDFVVESVNEIRKALLMNRNPEDVDSDNEYEEGILLYFFIILCKNNSIFF